MKAVGEDDFTTDSPLEGVTPGTRSEACAVIGFEPGSRPVVLAELLMVPRSMSAWVTTYVPVQVTFSLGASVAGVDGKQVSPPTVGSVTVTPVRVTLPVLVDVSV